MPGIAPRGTVLLHYALARALGSWGWRGGAEQACRDALARDPLFWPAHLLRGEMLAAGGRWTEAARCFREAARLRPSCPEVQGRLVLALGRARRFGEALAALDRLIRLRPGEAELHLLRGALLLRCGRRPEAIRAFRWAVGLPPAPEWRRCLLGAATLGGEEWERLAGSFARARCGDTRPSTLVALPGSALNRPPRLAPGTVEGAAPSRLRAPVGLPVGIASCVRSMGRVVVRARREALGQAGVALSRLLAPTRRSVLAAAFSLRQARRLAMAGRAAAGGALLLLLFGPPAGAAGPRRDSLAALEQLHLCYTLTRAKAVEPCKSALALGLAPARARWARRVLAYKLEALERWDEAVDVYREQVAEQPEDAEAHRRLGSLLLYAQNRPEEAAEELGEALRLAPQDVLAHGALAVAENARGRFAESIAEFERTLALDPAYLDGRPAAGLVLDASRRGERWP